MSDLSDWASRLVIAVTSQMAKTERSGDLATVQLHSIRATSPEVVEVIYSDFTAIGLRGIRIDHDSVQSGSERIRASSIGELALNLIYVGMLEPRSLDEFLPPDGNGVRWLPLKQWWEDVGDA